MTSVDTSSFFKIFEDPEFRGWARGLLPQDSAIQPRERLAVALECPKTAALCFDRIWSIPGDESECPPEIRFSASSNEELTMALFFHLWKRDREILDRVIDKKDALKRVAMELRRGDVTDHFRDPTVGAPVAMAILLFALSGSFGKPEEIFRRMSRRLASGVSSATNTPVVPAYASISSRDADFQPGSDSVVVGALSDLEVVDEDELTWEQVLEFRRDKTVRADYRRLTHWLNTEMAGKSSGAVVDEIGVRLDRYRAALTKHGLRSRLGVLSSVLDARALATAAAAGVGPSLAAGPIWGGLAAGSVLVGRVVLTLGQSKLDLLQLQQEHREVAFVSQVQSLREE